jgi:AcrR family transcriptional regulator
MSTDTIGRRERKKAQTRQALADAALRLFIEHGYDNVTVAQIADPAGKEALIFDGGLERRQALVAAVRDRPAGTPVLAALRAFMAGRGAFATDMPPELQRKRELIMATPALRGHQRHLCIASEGVLAEAIATDANRDVRDPAVRALARYVLEVPDLASDDPDPRESLDAIFELLETGWAAIVHRSAARRPTRSSRSTRRAGTGDATV